MTGEPLAELRLRLAPCDHERAFAALASIAPDGFRYDEQSDGGLEIGVYVTEADAEGDLHSVRVKLERSGLVASSASIEPVAADWFDRWKRFHQPVTVGRLWIGQPWHLPAPERWIAVVIDPGQGFGVGSHPTTRLVLSLLCTQPPGSVLDVGCGSGILAIAAAKLGHRSVAAIDNDPAAIESARANVARNGVRVTVTECDALAARLEPADLVLANLTLQPLRALAPRLVARRAIVSGLLRSQADAAADAFARNGYAVRERRDRDGWTALVLERGWRVGHRSAARR